MNHEIKVAVQNGAALGIGLVIWQIGQDWMIESGAGRFIAVFGSGAVAAMVAALIHWLAGKFLPEK